MAVKWETVKAGDVLYDVHKTKQGNTERSAVGCWTVVIETIDHEAGFAMVRWNGNPAKRYSRRQVERWRRNKPLPKSGV
jgi:hypothetical protein